MNAHACLATARCSLKGLAEVLEINQNSLSCGYLSGHEGKGRKQGIEATGNEDRSIDDFGGF
jgi:hypothetical protein